MNEYFIDFDPETKTFSLQDMEEQCIIIITKDQLEALMKFYRNCYE